MSSFLHSPTQFNSVQNALNNLLLDKNNGSYHLPYKLKKYFPECYDKSNVTKGLSEINDFMNTIRNLSVLCVNLQYKEKDNCNMINLDADIETEYKYLITNSKSIIKLNNIDLLKALQSINYQIETEHLEQLRALTPIEKASMYILTELTNSIALHIVSNTDEYNKSKGWSL